MTDSVFHLIGGQLVAMQAAPYDAEQVLQKLIEDFPDLLAGAQMSPSDPRRWLLIRREQPVPDRDGSNGRFNVDHLFVDQDAVPTLIEVKRSSDTRLRREVVGQMLDYAANGVRYWPASTLQAAFESTQSVIHADPVEAIAQLCGDATLGVEGFFSRVETNLRAGRLRLVFVADAVPDELLRIVEFLNEQMSQAEVFAVEVKQYRAEGRQDIVIAPRLLGRTASAATKASRGGGMSRSDQIAAASESTHQLIPLIDALASDADLITEESPSALLLKTPTRETLATLYFPWDTLDIPVQEVRDHGRDDEADRMFEILQRLTSKDLPKRHPSVPTEDAIAHWREIRSVLLAIRELFGLSAS